MDCKSMTNAFEPATSTSEGAQNSKERVFLGPPDGPKPYMTMPFKHATSTSEGVQNNKEYKTKSCGVITPLSKLFKSSSPLD
jgi:hypothetical protein